VYSFFLLALFLGLSNFITVQHFKSTEKLDAAIVNAAGRNRMLSQKIAFYAELVLKDTPGAYQVLQETIVLHEVSLKALKNGGVAPGIANNAALPAAPQAAMPALLKAETLWQQYKHHAEILVQAQQTKGSVYSPQEVQAAIAFIEKNAGPQLALNNELVKAYVNLNQQKQSQLNLILILFLGLSAVLMLAGMRLFSTKVIRPLAALSKAARAVARGQYQTAMLTHTDVYFKSIATAVNQMAQVLSHAIELAGQVGRGQYQYAIPKGLQQNSLLNSLDQMRHQIQQGSQQEQKQQWHNVGLSQLGGILQQHQNNTSHLSKAWLKALIQYVKLNQGGLFLKPTANANHMELHACYAWGRQKRAQKAIHMHEGLLGQAWAEGDLINLTEVPESHVNIRSGLGHACPRNLILVPLVHQQQVVGVLEVAGFTVLAPHEIEFIKQACAQLAQTLVTLQQHLDTRALMQRYQEQAARLAVQEEAPPQITVAVPATAEPQAATLVEAETQKAALQERIEALQQELALHQDLAQKGLALHNGSLVPCTCGKAAGPNGQEHITVNGSNGKPWTVHTNGHDKKVV